MTKPTFTFFTGTENLGVVYKESNEVIVKFLEFNLPGTSSSGRWSANLFGKTRVITIQGAHDGTGFSGATQEEKLWDFINTMEEWIDANFQTSKLFTNSFNHTFSVDCVDWIWTRSNTDPGRVIYTLMLKRD
jgi:hypothetical protein